MQPSFKQIVDDIVARHHSVLRKELPRITELLDGVLGEHPGSEPLIEAQQLFNKVRSKIETHLRDEETILFPTGIALESGGEVPHTEMDLRARLAEMEKEHDGCGNALSTVTQMVRAVPPSDRCNEAIQTITLVQEDLRIHAEKENTQVHPRFLELLATARV